MRDANDAELARLRELLAVMDPYAFEELVRSLLEKMGYEDVEVTRQSGDKGVDVVGWAVQFGITSVTEVVQVKWDRSNVQRPTLDQLRGVLPCYQALRGTIITLGGFSRGRGEAATFTGAVPITLLDGDRLIDLLVSMASGCGRSRSIYLK